MIHAEAMIQSISTKENKAMEIRSLNGSLHVFSRPIVKRVKIWVVLQITQIAE